MKNIYIVGFMGTGKTVVGKLLAQKLGREFIEMDALIEQSQSKAILEIFAEAGEAYFRKLEKNLLGELSLKKGLVVSCGGGLICDQDNLKLLKDSGTVFTLRAYAWTIHERTKKQTDRPLLEVEDPLKKIEGLLAIRRPYYEQADFIIDTDELNPEAVVDEIMKLVEQNDG